LWPAPLIPIDAEKWQVKIFHNVDQAIAWADVVMVLRIQMERQTANFFPRCGNITTISALPGAAGKSQ